jgi:hypothetical protein
MNQPKFPTTLKQKNTQKKKETSKVPMKSQSISKLKQDAKYSIHNIIVV